MRQNPQTIAREHCANWDRGYCLGIIMQTDKKGVVKHKPSSKYINKKCKLPECCNYFENIVVLGVPIPKHRKWGRAPTLQYP